MRIECLWVARLTAFVADFQACSSSCDQPPCHPRVFPQHACVVIALSSYRLWRWLPNTQWKNRLSCICLIVQRLVASGTKTFSTPRPKMFLQNLVVRFSAGPTFVISGWKHHTSEVFSNTRLLVNFYLQLTPPPPAKNNIPQKTKSRKFYILGAVATTLRGQLREQILWESFLWSYETWKSLWFRQQPIT